MNSGSTDRAAVTKAWIKSKPSKRWKIAEKALAGIKHKRVRDFMVVDGAVKFKSPSVVWHIPSGLWRGFTLPYDEMLAAVTARPEGDEELIQSIFATE